MYSLFDIDKNVSQKCDTFYLFNIVIQKFGTVKNYGFIVNAVYITTYELNFLGK